MKYISDILKKNSKKIGVFLKKNQIKKILKFIFLIKKWNKIYNLTSIKTSKKIIFFHILDSLTIIKYLKNKNYILDVGSGVGLPGIIIAILLEKISPKTKIHLIDSKNKKIIFLNQVKIELNLKNISIFLTRVENFKKKNFTI